MMAVMTSQKTSDPTEPHLTKKHIKSYYKTRPITATLEHPLILDIKLLKRLDMTTFTKKGLIALSKFCGISLITKPDTKRKFNKSVKSSASKKSANEVTDGPALKSQVKEYNKKDVKGKKKRKQISKPGTRIRFKLAEGSASMDEDSADVICKSHKLTANNKLTKPPGEMKLLDRKLILNDIINPSIENIIPEPCKTCCRSEHPERFHSHPKTTTKLNLDQKTNDKEEVPSSTTNNSVKDKNKKKMEKGSSANQKASSQESLSPNEESPNSDTSARSSPNHHAKISTSSKTSSESENATKSKNVKKFGSEVKLSNDGKNTKKTNQKVEETRKEENQIVSDENALKYITGCYLCGKQVSPKMRMEHEESCILEWRTQNSLLSPDKRKPEPRRPDFRFTATGDLDCQGTFESIWANHKESLVPCRKCGRTFFPDRIEKHQNCCNNAPISSKNKH